MVQSVVTHLFSLSGQVGDEPINGGGNASDNGNPELHAKGSWSEIWDD